MPPYMHRQVFLLCAHLQAFCSLAGGSRHPRNGYTYPRRSTCSCPLSGLQARQEHRHAAAIFLILSHYI